MEFFITAEPNHHYYMLKEPFSGMIFGCDEAGKGPVLGSMFVACVCGDKEDMPDGVKDSKRLSTPRIHELSEQIINSMQVEVVEVSPERIDKFSMTEVSNSAFVESIDGVDHRSCSKGYIDCYINNTETVTQTIQSNIDFSDSTELVVEFSADDQYDIVGAASIVAKSQREKHVESLSEDLGEVGSGYPSDPTTREFLKNYIMDNDEVPDVARRSWSTCQDLLDEHRSR